jgi:hypothetical protein
VGARVFAVKWLSVGGAGEIAPLAGGDDDDGADSALQDSGTTPFASAPRFAAEAGGARGARRAIRRTRPAASSGADPASRVGGRALSTRGWERSMPTKGAGAVRGLLPVPARAETGLVAPATLRADGAEARRPLRPHDRDAATLHGAVAPMAHDHRPSNRPGFLPEKHGLEACHHQTIAPQLRISY